MPKLGWLLVLALSSCRSDHREPVRSKPPAAASAGDASAAIDAGASAHDAIAAALRLDALPPDVCKTWPGDPLALGGSASNLRCEQLLPAEERRRYSREIFDRQFRDEEPDIKLAGPEITNRVAAIAERLRATIPAELAARLGPVVVVEGLRASATEMGVLPNGAIIASVYLIRIADFFGALMVEVSSRADTLARIAELRQDTSAAPPTVVDGIAREYADAIIAFYVAHELTHSIYLHGLVAFAIANEDGERAATEVSRVAETMADRGAVELVARAKFSPFGAALAMLVQAMLDDSAPGPHHAPYLERYELVYRELAARKRRLDRPEQLDWLPTKRELVGVLRR